MYACMSMSLCTYTWIYIFFVYDTLKKKIAHRNQNTAAHTNVLARHTSQFIVKPAKINDLLMSLGVRSALQTSSNSMWTCSNNFASMSCMCMCMCVGIWTMEGSIATAIGMESTFGVLYVRPMIFATQIVSETVNKINVEKQYQCVGQRAKHQKERDKNTYT